MSNFSLERREANELEWKRTSDAVSRLEKYCKKNKISEQRNANELERNRISDVISRLDKYYNEDESIQWLTSNHPQLGGQRPISLLSEDGWKDVLAIIDRLDADAYL